MDGSLASIRLCVTVVTRIAYYLVQPQPFVCDLHQLSEASDTLCRGKDEPCHGAWRSSLRDPSAQVGMGSLEQRWHLAAHHLTNTSTLFSNCWLSNTYPRPHGKAVQFLPQPYSSCKNPNHPAACAVGLKYTHRSECRLAQLLKRFARASHLWHSLRREALIPIRRQPDMQLS
jgi:hypothetical protein